MNETQSTAYQIDHTPLDVFVLDPSAEDQNVENYVHHYLIICYDPFSRLIEKTFVSTEEPTEHNVHELVSTLTLYSDRASSS
jgi:hypothetical protein